MAVRLVALWHAPVDDRFEERYRREHLPLVYALPGLVEAVAVPPAGGQWAVVATMTFEDLESLESALASPEGVSLREHTRQLCDAFATRVSRAVLDDANQWARSEG